MAGASCFYPPVTLMEAPFAPGVSPLRRLSPLPHPDPHVEACLQGFGDRGRTCCPEGCTLSPQGCPSSEAARFSWAVLGEVGTGPPVPLSFSPDGQMGRQAPSRQCPLAPGLTWQPSQLDTSLHLRGQRDSGNSGVHPGPQSG